MNTHLQEILHILKLDSYYDGARMIKLPYDVHNFLKRLIFPDIQPMFLARNKNLKKLKIKYFVQDYVIAANGEIIQKPPSSSIQCRTVFEIFDANTVQESDVVMFKEYLKALFDDIPMLLDIVHLLVKTRHHQYLVAEGVVIVGGAFVAVGSLLIAKMLAML